MHTSIRTQTGPKAILTEPLVIKGAGEVVSPLAFRAENLHSRSCGAPGPAESKPSWGKANPIRNCRMQMALTGRHKGWHLPDKIFRPEAGIKP